MNAQSTFEPCLDSRPEAFTAAASEMILAAPQPHASSRPAWGNLPIELPELGGLSFTDTNPWARGGLNE